MTDDIFTVRMLLVAGAGSRQEIWQQGATQVSVPVQFETADEVNGATLLREGGIDICIIEDGLPESASAGLVKAARAAQPQPFIVAAGGSAHLQDVDAVVPIPATTAEAHRLAELCIRARIPVRTLVVDDSPTMRSIVRKILAASRFALDVHEASEGNTAIERIRKGSYGMVFLDCNMPGLNGFETLSEIRRENPAVAVVMITSTADDALAERARKAGALGFLKKPFYPPDVDAVLERYYGLGRTLA